MTSVNSGYSILPKVAYATETEMVIQRGRVDTLEKEVHEARHAIEVLKEQNEQLRRQIAALRDGAWLRDF